MSSADGAVTATADRDVVIVIPCHNEESRLDLDRLAPLVDVQGHGLVFVDDGSTDATAAMVEDWTGHHDGVELLRLPRNAGKGEAVRAGLRRAIDAGASIVGYFDADLAAPPEELTRVVAVVTDDDAVDMAFGARVALLGTDIERSRSRHYQGRVFATVASLVLGLGVYDTQCGLKVIRVTPALDAALAAPFTTRWVFDVELIARLIDGPDRLAPDAIVEVPMHSWHDIGGSSLTWTARAGAARDLLRIARRRRVRGRPSAL